MHTQKIIKIVFPSKFSEIFQLILKWLFELSYHPTTTINIALLYFTDNLCSMLPYKTESVYNKPLQFSIAFVSCHLLYSPFYTFFRSRFFSVRKDIYFSKFKRLLRSNLNLRSEIWHRLRMKKLL